MMLFRKLREITKLDSELPDDVKRALVDSLYGPIRSLIVGAISGGLISLIVAYRAQDPWLTTVAITLCAVGAGRVASAWYYDRRAHPERSTTIRRWETIYAIGAGLFAGLLGLMAVFALMLSSDFSAHLVTATTAAGYAAGITGRNAGRPVIALSQVVLAMLPLALALMMTRDSLHVGLGFIILLFAYAMTDITLSARDTIVQALVSTRENAALAQQYASQAKLFDSALNNMSHGLCMFDRDNRLLVWNERFLELSGLPPTAVVPGARARDLLRRSVAIGNNHGANARRHGVDGDVALQPIRQMLARTADDRVISLSRRLMSDGGSVIIFEDITERRETEAHIARMATYDELTGLPNRATLRERMAKAYEAVHTHGGEFALHVIDLDSFKEVNDTLGHPIGDLLLQQVSDRLRAVASDANFVARFGGDEFVVVQFRFDRRDEVASLANRIVEAMKLSFDVQGHRIEIGASVGIAMAPWDGLDPDELMKRADMALYAAKAAGRGGYFFFELAMDDAAQARRALDLDLRDAIARDELEILYQPLIDIKTGRISSCEALLRWNHPGKGLIAPSEFIPIAEETGLIVALGDWVLQQSCAEAAAWPKATRLAVNLSPVQFKDPALGARVVAALARSGLPANRLELEITETIMLQDREATLTVMNDLKRLGVRWSLDDFGTGYSSLSYLRKFPFQKIKIDGSFVKDLERDDSSVAIIRAIASMGADLNMSIVVEGVETDAQLELVEREGCKEVQGFLLGRPMTATMIRQRLKGRRSQRAA
jgi:diguanylate cyclase (GGDEF)-like protein